MLERQHYKVIFNFHFSQDIFKISLQ